MKLLQSWCLRWRVWTDADALAPTKRTRALWIVVMVTSSAPRLEEMGNHVLCGPEQSVFSAAAELWDELQAQWGEVAAKRMLTAAPSIWLFAEPHSRGARHTLSSATDLAAHIESLRAQHYAKPMGEEQVDKLRFELELANSVWAVRREIDEPTVCAEDLLAETGLKPRRAKAAPAEARTVCVPTALRPLPVPPANQRAARGGRFSSATPIRRV